MKYPKNLSLYFLVLVALLLQGSPARNTFAQLPQSREVKLSDDVWPKDELEKYWQLQSTYNRPNPAVEGSKGMVAVTSEALAARVGLEALRQGGRCGIGHRAGADCADGGQPDQLRRHPDNGLL